MQLLKINNEAELVLYLQVVMLTILTLVSILLVDLRFCISLSSGSLICLLPTFYMYRRAFSFNGASNAKKIVNSFYFGQFAKFFLTVVLFTLAIKTPYILAAPLFIGYIATQLVCWLIPFVRIK